MAFEARSRTERFCTNLNWIEPLVKQPIGLFDWRRWKCTDQRLHVIWHLTCCFAVTTPQLHVSIIPCWSFRTLFYCLDFLDLVENDSVGEIYLKNTWELIQTKKFTDSENFYVFFETHFIMLSWYLISMLCSVPKLRELD